MDKERILIVEDDFGFGIAALMAFPEAESLLVENLEEGLRQIEKFKPTISLLDINIVGGQSFPIGEKLAKFGIPHIYVSAIRKYPMGVEAISIKKINKEGELEEVKRLQKTSKDQEVWQTAYEILKKITKKEG